MSEEDKKEEEQEQLIDETLTKVDVILRHVENVRDNCFILGKKLIEKGETEMGKRLIANGLVHDNSKFFGAEWDFLSCRASQKLDIAISQHNRTNSHHPEFWGGIEAMPRIALAEMVADWAARSSEFGTSLREWVEEGALHRYGYKKNGKVYKEIMDFVDLLCDKPFKQKKTD